MSLQAVYPSSLSAASKPAAEQFAALSALFNLTPNTPREKLLPEPYRSVVQKSIPGEEGGGKGGSPSSSAH